MRGDGGHKAAVLLLLGCVLFVLVGTACFAVFGDSPIDEARIQPTVEAIRTMLTQTAPPDVEATPRTLVQATAAALQTTTRTALPTPVSLTVSPPPIPIP